MLDSVFLWVIPFVVGTAERLASLLATYALHSTVLIAIAALVTWRRFPILLGPSAATLVWRFALVAGLVTTTAQLALGITPLGGRWIVPGGPSPQDQEARLLVLTKMASALPESHLLPPRASLGPRVLDSGPITLSSESSAQRTIALRISGRSAAVIGIAALWVVGALWFSVRLVLARRRMWNALARRVDATHTIAGASLREVQRLAAVDVPVTLTTSPILSSPAALPGDEICVPPRMLVEVDPLQQEAMLAHELAHIVRGDPGWLLTASWIEAAFWFQPLNRLARRQMQEAAEFACDEWAVRVTRAPVRLARALATVATWVVGPSAQPLALAPAMLDEHGSPLVKRVRRLTGSAHSPNRVPPMALVLGAALASTFAVAFAPRIDAPPRVRFALRVDKIVHSTRTPSSNTTSAKDRVGFAQFRVGLSAMDVTRPTTQLERRVIR